MSQIPNGVVMSTGSFRRRGFAAAVATADGDGISGRSKEKLKINYLSLAYILTNYWNWIGVNSDSLSDQNTRILCHCEVKWRGSGLNLDL